MRQIRGVSADLLVVDEAAFVPRDIWTSALPTIADRVRAGGKVILASTPWPVSDSWFRDFHNRGTNGDPNVASWHLPSSVNPNIGDEELADMQDAMNAEEYAREILAEWTSEQGAYFSPEEIDLACADYALMPPDEARNRPRGTAGAGTGPEVPGLRRRRLRILPGLQLGDTDQRAERHGDATSGRCSTCHGSRLTRGSSTRRSWTG